MINSFFSPQAVLQLPSIDIYVSFLLKFSLALIWILHCIPYPQTITRRSPHIGILVGLGLLLALASAASWAVDPTQKTAEPRYYSVFYDVRIIPNEHTAQVSIRLGEGSHHVRYIQLRTDPKRHQHFGGDGELKEVEGGIRWIPPRDGGELHYTFQIDHFRDNRGYDSRSAENWALFRGDDLVPPVRVRTKKGVKARAQLRFQLPSKWSAATSYPQDTDGRYVVDHPDRRFDRPTGWMVLGERLGVLRERIADSWVAIAGPVGEGLRRHDILALVRWTLPTLKGILNQLPDRENTFCLL